MIKDRIFQQTNKIKYFRRLSFYDMQGLSSIFCLSKRNVTDGLNETKKWNVSAKICIYNTS